MRPSNRTIGEYRLDKSTLNHRVWSKVVEYVKTEPLICFPTSGVFGLSIALAVFQIPNPAPYPGAEEGCEPAWLGTFTHRHLERVLGKEELRTKWHRLLTELVYNEGNKKLIAAHTNWELRELSYYDY